MELKKKEEELLIIRLKCYNCYCYYYIIIIILLLSRFGVVERSYFRTVSVDNVTGKSNNKDNRVIRTKEKTVLNQQQQQQQFE